MVIKKMVERKKRGGARASAERNRGCIQRLPGMLPTNESDPVVSFWKSPVAIGEKPNGGDHGRAVGNDTSKNPGLRRVFGCKERSNWNGFRPRPASQVQLAYWRRMPQALRTLNRPGDDALCTVVGRGENARSS